MDRSEFNRKMDELLTEAEQLVPTENIPDLPARSGTPEVPDWHAFELALWSKGEEIRQLLLETRKKPDQEHLDRIAELCTNPRAKRGRQSFVLLLGKKSCDSYAPQIAGLLGDEEVAGQAIDTLCKMGTADYLQQIKPFTEHHRTWIRNLAKKYVHKYSG